MLDVDCIETLDGFKELRRPWKDLSKNRSVFQTWEWAWSWWLKYGKGKRLFILTVRDGREVVGIAPLFISPYYNLPLCVSGFLGAGCSDYGDVLSVQGQEDSVAEALAAFLAGDSRWDALDLQQLPPGAVASRLERRFDDGPVKSLVQDECFNLELPDTYDQLLKTLSKKFRWNVQYYRRRLEREGELVFRETSRDTLAGDMKTFFALHKKRFLSKRKVGRFLSPRFASFHLEAAENLLDSERLGLFFLEFDGKPVASIYGYVDGSTYYYYLSGFDPEWGRMSVSTVLLSMVLEEVVRRGVNRFDFLRGAEPYKLKWGAVSAPNTRLVVGRQTAKSRLVCRLISKENDVVVRVKAREAES
ncbi:MAG: GNAT family N-acetyltransferase [Candidatus Aquicultorales bacterium]